MNFFQASLPLLQDVRREQEILPEQFEYLLDDIENEVQARRFAIQFAGRTATGVGEDLGISKSHWSGIINGTKNMSDKLKRQFMDLLGNDVLLQWEARRRGYRLVKREQSKEEQIEALETEIKKLKRQA
jgi:plasmid maintenance system antidote protein VapI